MKNEYRIRETNGRFFPEQKTIMDTKGSIYWRSISGYYQSLAEARAALDAITQPEPTPIFHPYP